MYVIGITGGVGSGKTVAAREIARICGADLLIADEIAHDVMEPGGRAANAAAKRLGARILDGDGRIDKKKLSEIIFNDPSAREAINEIVHPEVKARIEEYIADKKGGKGRVVLETALMFETGCDALCDEIWYVHVPEDVRIERLAESRGYSGERTRAIIAGQMSEEAFFAKADKVIDNSKGLSDLYAALRSMAAGFGGE